MNRLLGWLLHRFPRAFRERYGDELADVLMSMTKEGVSRLFHPFF
jgi:hypothetical protein